MKPLYKLISLSAISLFSSVGVAELVTATENPIATDVWQTNNHIANNYLAQANSSVISPATQVKETAQKITVRIDFPNGNGSGVIVARQGNTYYVLTNKHVVDRERQYQVVAPDGTAYPVDYTTIKQAADVDLAVLQFQSEQNYQVATLADYQDESAFRDRNNPYFAGNLMEQKAEQLVQGRIERTRGFAGNNGDPLAVNDMELLHNPHWAFLYGWKRVAGKPQATFTAGKYYGYKQGDNSLSVGNKPELFGGNPAAGTADFSYQDTLDLGALGVTDMFTYNNLDYEIVYTNPSFGGMSGSAVLDINGHVSAIHAASEGARANFDELQLGYSTGVLIGTFIDLADTLGINPQWLQIEQPSLRATTLEEDDLITRASFNLTSPSQNATAADWLNYGNQLWRLFRKQEAIIAMDKAIALDPNLAEAYYLKAKITESLYSNFMLSMVSGISSQFSPYQENQPDVDIQDVVAMYKDMWQQMLSTQEDLYQRSLTAYDNYQKATDLKPEFAQAWKGQGDLLLSLPSAELGAKRAKEIYSPLINNISANNFMPTFYQWMMQSQSAEQEQQTAVDPETQKLSAEKAVTAYDRAIAIKPENSFLYSKKAHALFVSGQCPAAIESLDKAIALEPLGSYYRQKAIVYLALKDIDNAEANYSRYREQNPISHESDFLKSVFADRNSLEQLLQTSETEKENNLFVNLCSPNV